jgi:hypothetical protein
MAKQRDVDGRPTLVLLGLRNRLTRVIAALQRLIVAVALAMIICERRWQRPQTRADDPVARGRRAH